MNLKRFNFGKNREFRIGLILFFAIFIIYTYTCAKYHVSFGDSDELSTIGYLLGVAHQPGYPLYILFIFLFTHLIPFGSIAFRANLTSVLFQSLTVFISYLISLEVLKDVKLRKIDERVKKKKYQKALYFFIDTNFRNAKIIFSLLSSLLLAFSFLFWLYANTAEVFGLNDFFISMIVYLVLILTRYAYANTYADFNNRMNEINMENLKEHKVVFDKGKQKKVFKLLVIISCLAGLGLSHLQTIILAYPVIFLYLIYILYKSNSLKTLLSLRKITTLFSIFIASFIAPFLLLFLFNSTHSPVSWAFDSSISGLFADITRQQYSKFILTGNSYIEPISTSQSLGSIIPYFNQISTSFTVIPMILFYLGMIYMFLRNKRNFLLFIGLFLFTGLFFIMYAKYPTESDQVVKYFGDVAILQRQFIMGIVFMTTFFSMGMLMSYRLLLFVMQKGSVGTEQKKKTNKIAPKYNKFNLIFSAGSIIILVLMGLIYEFKSNYASSDLHSFNYVENYAKSSLQSTNENSVIICFTDLSCFSYLYEQYVNHTRPDITIVPSSYMLRKDFLDNKKDLQKFYYSDNPQNIADILTWNMYHHRDVYLSGVTTDFISYLGLNGQAFFLYPNGYLDKVVEQVPSNYSESKYADAKSFISYFDNNSNDGTSYKNYMEKFLKGYFTGTIVTNLYIAREEAFYGNGKISYNIGYNLKEGYDYYDGLIKNITGLAGTMPYYPGLHVPDTARYYELAQQNINKSNDALGNAILAMFRDPLNVDARLLVANEYKKVGQNENAKIEFENVLKLQPKNELALQGLNSL